MNRLLRKIGLLITLMLFCVGMASAASYDTYDREVEQQTGYISVEKLNNHRERFKSLQAGSATMYIDLDSIKVVQDDSHYRVISYKVATIDPDFVPMLFLSEEMARFNMEDRETIETKTVYYNAYELDGKYVTGGKVKSTYSIVPMWTPAYVMSTGAYGFVYHEIFDEQFKKKLVEKKRARSL